MKLPKTWHRRYFCSWNDATGENIMFMYRWCSFHINRQNNDSIAGLKIVYNGRTYQTYIKVYLNTIKTLKTALKLCNKLLRNESYMIPVKDLLKMKRYEYDNTRKILDSFDLFGDLKSIEFSPENKAKYRELLS